MEQPKRSFIVVTTQRSGSIWLMKLLDSHSAIDMAGEVFKADYHTIYKPDRSYFHFKESLSMTRRFFSGRKRTLKSYLQNEAQLKSGKITGFKLMVDQMKIFPELEQQLEQMGYRIIKLYRRNLLRKRVSQLLARKSKLYVMNSDDAIPKDDATVTIPVNDLVANLDALAKEQHFLKLSFVNSNVLEIYYEDMVENTEISLEQVQIFLGLPVEKLQADTKKINNHSIEVLTNNFAEVQATLKGSKYDQFL